MHRRALLAVSVSFEKTLSTVFKERDEENSGILSLNDFARILVNLGSALNSDEISLIAGKYKATENYGKGRNSVSEFNGFYDSDKLEGTKRNFSSSGKARVHTQTHTLEYSNTYIHTIISMNAYWHACFTRRTANTIDCHQPKVWRQRIQEDRWEVDSEAG